MLESSTLLAVDCSEDGCGSVQLMIRFFSQVYHSSVCNIAYDITSSVISLIQKLEPANFLDSEELLGIGLVVYYSLTG
jgi:hypothetical protein